MLSRHRVLQITVGRDRLVVAGLIWVAALCGCREHSDAPVLATVDGVVLFQGEPVGGAMVEFVCRNSPVRSAATTTESGEFSMSSFAPNDGVPVGTCKVTVKKLSLPSSAPSASRQADANDKTAATSEDRLKKIGGPSPALQATRDAYRKGVKQRNVLPSKYSSPDTTDLQFEVKPGVKNRFVIELKK